MRGERGLVAGVVAAVLVYPVAECSFVDAEFSCDLGDRAGSVDHKSHGLVPELGTELAVLPCHSLHHLPGQILLDRGPRTTGHLRMRSVSSVLAVRTKRSAKQFPRGHRGGILTVSMPAPARTASKAVVNWPARSRMRNRKVATRSSKSISRLRACWVVQGPVGWLVVPRMWT